MTGAGRKPPLCLNRMRASVARTLGGAGTALSGLRGAVAGLRRCRVCGKAFELLDTLGQHLKDAHGGHNSPRAAAAASGERGHPPGTDALAAGPPGGGARSAPRPSPSPGLSLGDLFAAALKQPRRSRPEAGGEGRGAGDERREAARTQWRQAAEAARQLTATRGVQGTLKVWAGFRKH